MVMNNKATLTAVAIELTNACNLRCKQCTSRNSGREVGFMDIGMFRDILDQLYELKTARTIALYYGGEPLMHPKFAEFARCIREYGDFFHWNIFSNGSMLDEHIADVLIKTGMERITISLDGVREVHEHNRPGSNYGRVAKNINKLLKMRGRRKRPLISVNMTTTSETTDDQVKDLIIEWGDKVDWIGIGPAITRFGLRPNHRVLGEYYAVNSCSRCEQLFYYTAILWNGDVMTCCDDLECTQIMGSIKKNKIIDVFNNTRYEILRKAGVCAGCEMKTWPGYKILTKKDCEELIKT